VFASDRCDQLEDPWWDEAIPIRFHDEDRSLAAIQHALGSRGPDGILAVGDRPTAIASRAAAAFGLPGNPVHAVRASRNKLAARHAFDHAGMLAPSFTRVPLTADPRPAADAIGYPVVIKPLALSGSRGVMRVDDAQALPTAWERLRRLMTSPDVVLDPDAEHDVALVESFIEGREFAVEGVLTRGAFQPFTIFDKPDPLDGPFFEETIYVTPSRLAPANHQAIVDAVAAATRALGLMHGPVHAECRVSERGVYVLEVAARPIGGLCSKALRFVDAAASPECAAGRARLSLEQVLLRHAIGQDVARVTREPEASGVMMIPIPRRGVFKGVDGTDAARRVPGIDDVTIAAKTDTVLEPLPEGRSYLGFIFAHGGTPAVVEQALRDAHARLRVRIEKALTVVK
jgi:hypothetical protein